MLRRLTGVTFFALMVVGIAPSAQAQQVLGAGDDALTVPRGTVRLDGTAQWSWFNQTFGPDGKLRPLGAAFNFDSIGTAQLPILTPLQTSLRALTGGSSVNVSLGKTVVSLNDRVQTTPIALQYGVTNRFQIGVTVPIVRTRSNVFVNVNPTGTEGNVAVNPAGGDPTSTAFVQDATFVNQIMAAANAVVAYCAGKSTSQCASATSLASSATTFATTLGQVYEHSQFVPTQQSNIQAAIDIRSFGFKSQLNAYAAMVGSTFPQITAIGVAAAPAPLVVPDLQEILVTSEASDPLNTIDLFSLGDIELAAKLMLLDSFHGDIHAQTHPQGFNERVSFGVSYRLPTGQISSPANLTELSTGTHEAALGVSGYTDILIGSHFWTSVIARYDNEFTSTLTMRLADPANPLFVPQYRQDTVHRQLGNLLEIEATPRWVVNEFLSLTGQYTYRRKPLDTYTGTPYTVGPDSATGETTITIYPATFGAGSAFTEHRIGGGFSFSNMYAVSQGRSSLPIEASYLHYQTIKGSGNVPLTFGDEIRIRIYASLFGR